MRTRKSGRIHRLEAEIIRFENLNVDLLDAEAPVAVIEPDNRPARVIHLQENIAAPIEEPCV